MLEWLLVFLSIFYFTSPVGISSLWGHLWIITICLSTLRKISRYYFFWLFIIISFLFAQEKRFSLEYVLFAMSLFSLGFNSRWEEKHRKFLFWIFLFLILANQFKLDFFERGSLLLFLPVYLSLYYKEINKKNFLVYLGSSLALFFSNKLSSILAFILSLRRKIFYLLSVLLLLGYFFLKQSFSEFLLKSFKPRLYIWKSIADAFFEKPFFGHGFGTFALDFSPYRVHSNVLGGRINELVVHGHNLFFHYAFELGLLGISLMCILLYLIYINVRQAFLPFLIISLFDTPLVNFNQVMLAGFLISPCIKDFGIFKNVFNVFSNKHIKNILFVFSVLLSSYVFVPSLVGHYFYDTKNIDEAIKWDNKNSLYWFTRGSNNLNTAPKQSEADFTKAIELSPSVSYFYGFLGAAQLANNKSSEAKQNLKKAIAFDGYDGYWCLMYAYANYNDKVIFKEYFKKALKKNPEIKEILANPQTTSAQYLGTTKKGDARLVGFYRMGDNIYFPLPVISNLGFTL